MNPFFRTCTTSALLIVLCLGASFAKTKTLEKDKPEVTNSSKAERATFSLDSGWKFKFQPSENIEQILSDAAISNRWENVSVPHSWNALDGQSIQSSYKRGIGFYRLDFKAPTSLQNERYWIEFDAVSLVSNVWLNGSLLGRHEGGFGRFRFDITDQLKLNASNTLIVKADNSEQKPGADTQNVPPFSGDFMVQGGLYRNVRIFSTPSVHIDTLDDGGLGVYAKTVELNSSKAVVHLKTLITNELAKPQNSELVVLVFDAQGALVSQESQSLEIQGQQTQSVEQYITLRNPHPWSGKSNPYLYRLQVKVMAKEEKSIDAVSTALGLRQVRVDKNLGFFLNNRPYPLHGVAMHQDFKDKGWGSSVKDKQRNFELIQEIGANTIRFSHYPYDQLDYEMADQRGLVVYTEVPLVDTATNNAQDLSVSPAVTSNMIQQVKEMIKQNYNHPSVAFWGMANEIGFTKRFTPNSSPESLRELFNQLRQVAHGLDSSRPTSQADVLAFPSFSQNEDVSALNRYYGWYDTGLDAERILGDFKNYGKERPNQPVGLTEYGFGAQITQHTDEPRVISLKTWSPLVEVPIRILCRRSTPA
jgi:beta-galactosidase